MTEIIDKTGQILLKNNKIKDHALARAAGEIDTIIKTAGRTPFKHGFLKNTVRHEKISDGQYRIVVPAIYAAYQERGMRADGTHVVKKYTTPGTGKGWFQAALNTTAKDFINIIKEAARLEGY